MSGLEEWTEIEPLGEGGQGRTAIVRHAVTGETAVIKRLHDDASPTARARMAREAASLRIVHSLGGRVPRVIADNSDAVESDDELLIVMEFIDGHLLSKSVSDSGPMSLDEAIAITLALADTVRRGHDVGVLHRDIKPDNIMLEAGEPRTPVLLDYGLSFKLEDELPLTGPEMLDSRFLNLPELRVEGDDRHDPRSDVTRLAGVLVFMISGQRPVELTDGDGKAPHRRGGSWVEPMRSDSRWVGITTLLDRAFALRLDDRLGIAEFEDRLTSASNDQPQEHRDFDALAWETTNEVDRNRTDIEETKATAHARRLATSVRDAAAARLGGGRVAGDFTLTLTTQQGGGTPATAAPITWLGISDLTAIVQYAHSDDRYVAHYQFAKRGPEIVVFRTLTGLAATYREATATDQPQTLRHGKTLASLDEAFKESIEFLYFSEDADDAVAGRIAADAEAQAAAAVEWIRARLLA